MTATPMLGDRDALASRAKFGVIGPSTNTIVQPDFEAMRPAGVTNHYSRIFVQNAQALSNESFTAGTRAISRNLTDAVDAVLTCAPDFLVMGVSAITFEGGKAGAEAFQKAIEDRSGLGLACGSQALIAAFGAYGGIRRIAFVSPYYPVANALVRGFMADHGIVVARDICLQCPSWTAIAHVREDHLAARLAELDGDDVDALVQVGTNMSMVALAARTEAALGKPVIAINTATYWHALRRAGIDDRMTGFGRLLAEF
ncbi:MAG: maleate cis-trans isomerase family protein [Polymorphobacter sp.]